VGGRKGFGHHEFPRGNPTVAGAFVSKIDNAAGNFAQELVAYLAAKEKFLGVTIEEKAKPSIKSRPAE
jgi:hypothetical protein